MATASELDVIESMTQVIDQYENEEHASFKQKFESGVEVTTIYQKKFVGDHVRHDYGIPAMYLASEKILRELPLRIWRDAFPFGRILPRQYKPYLRRYQVNFVVLGGSGATLLNYHVSVG